MQRIFLTPIELADRWRVSPRTLENWRAAGRPPEPVRIGRRVLYRLVDVEAQEQAEYARIRGVVCAQWSCKFPVTTTPTRGWQ